MTIKLYGAPMSACTARVLACLHELGVKFELLPVNLAGGEHKQPPFLAKNPFGQIPALEDHRGDHHLTLFESRAISSYLAEKFKGSSGSDLLRTQNLKEASLVKTWMEVESQNFNPAISPIFDQHYMVPMLGGSPNQAIIDENSEKLGKVLDVYEKKLRSTKYLAGDFYSLADLHHLPYIYYLMKTPGAKHINQRPHVHAWWEDISSRPAFQKVAPGLTLGK